MLAQSTISFFDLAYAAGIMDGEGSIYLTESMPRALRRERTPRFELKVSVGMTTKEVPFWLHAVFGGGVVFDGNKKNPIWKATYLWRLTGRKAAEFLRNIRPFLKLKGMQADLAMLFAKECIQNPRMRRYSVMPEEIEKRHTFVVRMRALNKRGNPAPETLETHDVSGPSI